MNTYKVLGLMLVMSMGLQGSQSGIPIIHYVNPFKVTWIFPDEKDYHGNIRKTTYEYTRDTLVDNLEDTKINKYDAVSITDDKNHSIPGIVTLENLSDRLSQPDYQEFENKYSNLIITLKKKGIFSDLSGFLGKPFLSSTEKSATWKDVAQEQAKLEELKKSLEKSSSTLRKKSYALGAAIALGCAGGYCYYKYPESTQAALSTAGQTANSWLTSMWDKVTNFFNK